MFKHESSSPLILCSESLCTFMFYVCHILLVLIAVYYILFHTKHRRLLKELGSSYEDKYISFFWREKDCLIYSFIAIIIVVILDLIDRLVC